MLMKLPPLPIRMRVLANLFYRPFCGAGSERRKTRPFFDLKMWCGPGNAALQPFFESNTQSSPPLTSNQQMSTSSPQLISLQEALDNNENIDRVLALAPTAPLATAGSDDTINLQQLMHSRGTHPPSAIPMIIYNATHPNNNAAQVADFYVTGDMSAPTLQMPHLVANAMHADPQRATDMALHFATVMQECANIV
jgi:hypothetical protein